MTNKNKRRKVIESLSCLGKLLQGDKGIGSAVDDLKFMLTALSHPGPPMFGDPNRFLQEFWDDVAESLAAGAYLSDALQKPPNLIDHELVDLIAVGEKQGNLPEILYELHSGATVTLTEAGKSKIIMLTLGHESAVVNLANKILFEANEKGAEEITFPLQPDGVTPLSAEPSLPESGFFDNLMDELGDGSKPSSIYFRIAGKWKDVMAVPDIVAKNIILRFLFMADLPHWKKAKISGIFAVKTHEDSDSIQYSLTYYPDPLSLALKRMQRG